MNPRKPHHWSEPWFLLLFIKRMIVYLWAIMKVRWPEKSNPMFPTCS